MVYPVYLDFFPVSRVVLILCSSWFISTYEETSVHIITQVVS